MIHMPRRSVTRFFIPLIDVLLLTFGVFLLMPIAAETELEEQRQQAAEKGESALGLQHALQDRLKELYKLEELRPDLDHVDELKKEIDLLRNLAQKSLQQSLTVKVIETDPKTGAILYYDPANAEQPVTPIPDAAAAHALIEQHKKEAPGRNLYYQFLRRRGPFPTLGQGRQYRAWFKDVPNSLEVQP
jgi:hypothetical protein